MARIHEIWQASSVTDEELKKLDKWYIDNKTANYDCNEVCETPFDEQTMDDEGIAVLSDEDFDIVLNRTSINLYIIKM